MEHALTLGVWWVAGLLLILPAGILLTGYLLYIAVMVYREWKKMRK